MFRFNFTQAKLKLCFPNHAPLPPSCFALASTVATHLQAALQPVSSRAAPMHAVLQLLSHMEGHRSPRKKLISVWK